MNDTTEFRLSGEIGTVNNGIKYERYADSEQTIEVGDILAHQDPDAGMHAGPGCELINRAEYAGHVTGIYYHPERDEVTITTSSTSHAPPEHFTDDHPLIILFEESDYDEWMGIRWHMGEHGVSEEAFEAHDGPECEYCMGKDDGHETIGR